MSEKSGSSYRTYLLRCWREGSDLPDAAPTWRFSVEEVLGERRRHGFGNLEDVAAFLQEKLLINVERKNKMCNVVQQYVGVIDKLTDDRHSRSWRRVEFPHPFEADLQVVVLAMSQTHNGPDTPGLRIQRVDQTGFEIRYDEVIWHDAAGRAQGSQGRHPQSEKVGWVAYGYR